MAEGVEVGRPMIWTPVFDRPPKLLAPEKEMPLVGIENWQVPDPTVVVFTVTYISPLLLTFQLKGAPALLQVLELVAARLPNLTAVVELKEAPFG